MTNRDRKQIDIVAKWFKVFFGTLVAATGFGKTRVALIAIKNFIKNNPGAKILIVVPTDFLQDQWRGYIVKHLFDNCQIKTIHEITISRGLALALPIDCDLLILDEVHLYTSAVFGQIFNIVTAKAILALTATLVGDDDRAAIIEAHCPVFENVTLAECRREGWVSEFTVYNWGLKMSDIERVTYKALSADLGRGLAMFGHDFKLAMACMKKEPRKNYAQMTGKKESSIFLSAQKVIKATAARKDMLYHSLAKLDAITQIYHKFPNKLTMAFSQTVKMADMIKDHLNILAAKEIAVSYHTKVKGCEMFGKYMGKDKVLSHYISRFSDVTDEIRYLSAAKALDVGADIPDVDFGIITSGTSKVRQNIQRIGRIIRKVEGKVAIIVQLYMLDSQDEKWLKSRSKGTPTQDVKFIRRLDEIEYVQ